MLVVIFFGGQLNCCLLEKHFKAGRNGFCCFLLCFSLDYLTLHHIFI